MTCNVTRHFKHIKMPHAEIKCYYGEIKPFNYMQYNPSLIRPAPKVVKNFMLNSAGHEILNARKYKDIKKFIFLGSDKPTMIFPAHKC